MVIRSIEYNEEYVEAILQMYVQLVDVSFFPPDIHVIHAHYDSIVDTKIVNLQVQIYGDDFYDGRPGQQPSILPDMIKDNLEENIRIPIATTLEEIANVLNQENIVYQDTRNMYNQPIVGVW